MQRHVGGGLQYQSSLHVSCARSNHSLHCAQYLTNGEGEIVGVTCAKTMGKSWRHMGFEVVDQWQVQGLTRVSSAKVAKFQWSEMVCCYVGRKPEGKVVWIPWKAPECRSDYAQRVRRESNGRSLHN